MTTMIYGQMAKNIKQWKAGFPLAWIVFTLLIVVTVKLQIEDYATSYYGYGSFPTAKATNVVWAVAAIPQLLQSAMVYITIGLSATRAKDRNWNGFDVLFFSIMIWVTMFLLDGYWDYTYKSANYISGGGIYWPGVIDSFGIYGLLSEVLGTFSISVWLSLTQEGAVVAVAEMFGHLIEIVIETIRLVFKILGDAIGIVTSPLKVQAVPNRKSKPQPKNNSRKGQPGKPKNRQSNSRRPAPNSSNPPRMRANRPPPRR